MGAVTGRAGTASIATCVVHAGDRLVHNATAAGNRTPTQRPLALRTRSQPLCVAATVGMEAGGDLSRAAIGRGAALGLITPASSSTAGRRGTAMTGLIMVLLREKGTRSRTGNGVPRTGCPGRSQGALAACGCLAGCGPAQVRRLKGGSRPQRRRKPDSVERTPRRLCRRDARRKRVHCAPSPRLWQWRGVPLVASATEGECVRVGVSGGA